MALINRYTKFFIRFYPKMILVMLAIVALLSVYFKVRENYFSKSLIIGCNQDNQELGVQSTRSVYELKLYLESPEKFETLPQSSKDLFFKELVRVENCDTVTVLREYKNYALEVKSVKYDRFYILRPPDESL